YTIFVNEFININEVDFEKLDKGKYQILFCTRGQLENNCKVIRDFYRNFLKNDINIEKLKIVGDEKMFNEKKYNKFLIIHKINNIPSILLLENGEESEYVILTNEEQ
ncbi:MAG: hypothetical protein E6Z48_17220, partial [Clostridium butyricum]|nr:hypothetical protein [Clostridium butyricum]